MCFFHRRAYRGGNNAGTSIRKPTHLLELEEWHTVMNTNLTSAFLCSKAAYPSLKASGHGKVINIGSMMSIFAGSYAPAYAASKGGIVQFSRSCACAWAPDNIQVNAILPGWIDTDLTKGARQQVALADAGERAGILLDRIDHFEMGWVMVIPLQQPWVVGAAVLTIFVEGSVNERAELAGTRTHLPVEEAIDKHPMVAFYGCPRDAMGLVRAHRAVAIRERARSLVPVPFAHAVRAWAARGTS